ncbi:MAG: IS1634 family transposase [Anaerolineae bacterium]|nr:IS1634 family transposase [Anaerolineae bacterium]
MSQADGADEIVDQELGAPHGNWEGLSYGEVALVFIAYVVMSCTHFLSPMEEWAEQHLMSLSHALGKPVRVEDFTDDRLAILLSRLGDEQAHPGEQIEKDLGQRIIRTYELPTETARVDLTSISVYHQPPAEDPGLMRFGRSKDHRPDLRQFKAVLGTLDPAGMPLATDVLSGEQADDPHYIPIWDRMAATLGHTGFLAVGDCKMGSLETRAYIQDHHGFYLMPLPMTGNTPKELQDWVLNPPCPPQAIWLPGQRADEPAVGQGFEVTIACSRQNPDTEEEIVDWNERRLVIQSEVHANKQRNGLQERLAKAEASLMALNSSPAAEQAELERQAQAIVKRYRVTEYLHLSFIEQITSQTRYVGPGRPGPNRSTQTIQTHTWTVEVTRQTDIIDRFNCLAGWRVYATNAPAHRLDLTGAVNCYRQEWQPEHGFHRLKGGSPAIMPLYIRDDERIAGLLLLLGIALRLLTLIEFVTRRDLAATNESLKGLYAGNPNRATNRPTTERLLKAFGYLTLYRLETVDGFLLEITPLSPLQRRILQALRIPVSIYAPPPVPIIDSS